MIIAGIPLRDLHRVWSDLWPLLEPAVKRSPDVPDACAQPAGWVLARLIARDAQLWAVYDKGRPVAAVVTTLQIGPSDKRCLLWLVGGGRLGQWAADFVAVVEAWARAMGCVALWGSGRPGWTRIVKHFGGERIADHNGQPAWQRRIV
jgi:hypothetical protein